MLTLRLLCPFEECRTFSPMISPLLFTTSPLGCGDYVTSVSEPVFMFCSKRMETRFGDIILGTSELFQVQIVIHKITKKWFSNSARNCEQKEKASPNKYLKREVCLVSCNCIGPSVEAFTLSQFRKLLIINVVQGDCVVCFSLQLYPYCVIGLCVRVSHS